MSELGELNVDQGNSLGGESALLEAQKISRFFYKLLEESLSLGASKITFDNAGAELFCGILRDADEIKKIKLKASWAPLLRKWIENRVLSWVTRENSDAGRFVWKLGSRFVVADLKLRGLSGSFSLENLGTAKYSEVVKPLDLTKANEDHLSRMFAAEKGLIIATAPLTTKIDSALNFVLSFSAAVFVPEWTLKVESSKLKGAAEKALIVASMPGHDAYEDLLRLREFGFSAGDSQVLGVVSQALIPRVCASCARETALDKQLLHELPKPLQVKPDARYLIGRGCPQCNQAGYKGWVGIQSIISVDKKLQELLGAKDTSGALSHAFSKGTRSLLQDGVEKAFSGIATLEGLFRIVKTMPDGYLKVINKQQNGRPVDGFDPPIQVSDNFFDGESDSVRNEKAAPQALFRAGGADVIDGDQPLFSVGVGRKIRAKPLVLVVEDDADQLEILQMVFQTSSYDIVTARDGQQALDQLAKELPDLVVTDLMMPNMDGAELVKKMKRSPKYSKIPVLVLTVLSDAEKEVELLDIGADDYVEKTVQRKVLLKRVEKILKR